MLANISKDKIEIQKQLFSNPQCNIIRHESSVNDKNHCMKVYCRTGYSYSARYNPTDCLAKYIY